MEEYLPFLAAVETYDNGKPIRETNLADIPLAVDHFRYFASCVRAQEGSLGELDDDTVAYHYHEPLGVVGQIIPWNFPILMAAWKLAPALAAGNAVVIKPAEQTPMSLLVLAELVQDILPPGVLNIVNGFGLEAGKPLASSSRIGKIAFTGETTTGRLIMQLCLRKHHSRHPRARRQVAEYLLRGRHARGRCLRRQGAGGVCHVRAEPRRSVHLPVPGAGTEIHLRSIHGARREKGAVHPSGRPV